MSDKGENTQIPAKRLVTSVDVAKLAMVSQSTVSRAFSDASLLLPETRKRVLDAALTLGYRPNAIARSLASNRTNIIGLIIMRNSSPFYNHLVDLMVVACRKYGYSAMMIRQAEGESGAETVARALEYRVDGVVVTAIEDTESACEICRQASVPIVLLNRYIDGAGVDSVCADNYSAGEMIIEYLASKGHKTVACLMGDPSASTSRERLKGMLTKASPRGLDIVSVQHGDYTYQSGQDMCRQLVTSGRPLPDVIFCSGDIIAFGAMDVLRYEFNLCVPADVSVIGFDDTTQAVWASYNLTTVRQPYDWLVDTACQLLVRRMDAPDEGIVRATHVCQLVERGSVRDLTL